MTYYYHNSLQDERHRLLADFLGIVFPAGSLFWRGKEPDPDELGVYAEDNNMQMQIRREGAWNEFESHPFTAKLASVIENTIGLKPQETPNKIIRPSFGGQATTVISLQFDETVMERIGQWMQQRQENLLQLAEARQHAEQAIALAAINPTSPNHGLFLAGHDGQPIAAIRHGSPEIQQRELKNYVDRVIAGNDAGLFFKP